MAFREVTMIEIREVVRQWLGGRGTMTVARAMGIAPKTARRCLRAAEPVGFTPSEGRKGLDDERFLPRLAAFGTPAMKPESEGHQRCVEHREFVQEKLRQSVRLTKSHRRRKRRDASVTDSTRYRFAVEELDFGKNAATVPVVDGKPGEEVQLDVGTVTLPEPDATGRRRRRLSRRRRRRPGRAPRPVPERTGGRLLGMRSLTFQWAGGPTRTGRERPRVVALVSVAGRQALSRSSSGGAPLWSTRRARAEVGGVRRRPNDRESPPRTHPPPLTVPPSAVHRGVPSGASA